MIKLSLTCDDARSLKRESAKFPWMLKEAQWQSGHTLQWLLGFWSGLFLFGCLRNVHRLGTDGFCRCLRCLRQTTDKALLCVCGLIWMQRCVWSTLLPVFHQRPRSGRVTDSVEKECEKSSLEWCIARKTGSSSQ